MTDEWRTYWRWAAISVVVTACAIYFAWRGTMALGVVSCVVALGCVARLEWAYDEAGWSDVQRELRVPSPPAEEQT